MTDTHDKLAIDGGKPVRETEMPARFALGSGEEAMIAKVIDHYRELGLDPGYQGHFEQRYCDAFVEFMGGGYADCVATGTTSLYVALAALDLPKGSEILVSPITDPGSLSAIVLNGLKPRVVDSMPGSYNIGPEEFKARISPQVKAAMVVHAIGQAAAIDKIVAIAHEHGIKVLEDCSQAHGAKLNGKLVGTFGDIAAFSTMHRKAHMTGSCGGVVFSRDQDLLHLAMAHADRGKPSWQEGFDDRNPNYFLFPALNLHSNEISCAMGIPSLARLGRTIADRLAFICEVTQFLEEKSKVCRPYGCSTEDSPFVYPIFVDGTKVSCSKMEFAQAVRAEGIGLNPHYEYVVADWPFLKPYLADDFDTVNARAARDSSFILYVNEHYTSQEAADCVEAILKVEDHFLVR